MSNPPIIDPAQTQPKGVKILCSASLLCAGFAACLGALALLVWFSQSQALVTQGPWLFMMKVNTALLMLASGIGLVFCTLDKKSYAYAAGIFTCILSGLTLVQYLTGWSLGIDELLIRDYVYPTTNHPGRPAPNTSSVFFCLGIAVLLLADTRRQTTLRIAVSEWVGLVIFALSCASMAGYLGGPSYGFSWGTDTAMSVPTTLGCFSLSIGIMLLTWLRQGSYRWARVPLWIPAVLCVILLWFDMYTSLGVAAGIAYVLLVFSSLWFTRPYMVFVLAALATTLIIFGYFISPPPPSEVIFDIVLLNRALSIAAIWLMAAVIYYQRRTSQTLTNTLVHHRTVLNTTVDGIITINAKGIVYSFNPACEKIFGYAAAEVINRNISMLMTDEHAMHHDGYLHNYQKTGHAKVIGIGREVEGKRKDGSFVSLDLSVSKMIINGEVMYSGMVRDISERKAAEQKLHEAKEELELIFDNVPAGIWYKDDQNTILRCNRFAAATVDKTPEELIGKRTEDLFPEMAEKYLQDDRQVIRSGKPKLGIVERYTPKDKPHGWIRTDKVPFQDPITGQSVLIAVAQDITMLKEAEQQLEALVEKLTSSNEELERFAYICSHDLQEPLRIIRNYVVMLEKQCGDAIKNDARAQRYMHFITESAARSQDLINDILAYARMGQESKAHEKVPLEMIFKTITQTLAPTIAEKKASITCDDLPVAIGNHTQFLQLFQNLISNALKFSTAHCTIHVGAKKHKGDWEFYVQDNGIGIEPEYREKIFVIFQRLNRRSDYPGNGIGLAICKKIVSNYGGTISVDSELEKGTTFRFTLPEAFPTPKRSIATKTARRKKSSTEPQRKGDTPS